MREAVMTPKHALHVSGSLPCCARSIVFTAPVTSEILNRRYNGMYACFVTWMLVFSALPTMGCKVLCSTLNRAKLHWLKAAVTSCCCTRLHLDPTVAVAIHANKLNAGQMQSPDH